MKFKIILVVLVVISVGYGTTLSAGGCDEGTWKWKDSTGKTRYSNAPPEYAMESAVCLRPLGIMDEYNQGLQQQRYERIKRKRIAREKEAAVRNKARAEHYKREKIVKAEKKRIKKEKKEMAEREEKFARSIRSRILTKKQARLLARKYSIMEKGGNVPIDNPPPKNHGFFDVNGDYYPPAGGSNAIRDSDGTFMLKIGGRVY